MTGVDESSDVVSGIFLLARELRREIGDVMATEQWAIDAGFRPPCLGVLSVVAKLGPVSQRAISDHLGLTTSKDVLEAVGRGDGPRDVFVSLGYAGWSAGQLEHELGQNAWLTVEADADLLFGMPAEQRLPAAMQLLGIDFSRLSEDVGHA